MRRDTARGTRQAAASLLVCALLLATAARAGEFVRIEHVQLDALAAESFRLDRPARLHVRSEGAGNRREETLYAYGWLQDLQSREVVWQLQIEGARRGPGDNYAFDGDVELPAGEYTAYFTSFTQPYRRIRYLGKDRGRVYIKRGDREPRHAKRWGLLLAVPEADADAVRRFEPPARRADPRRIGDLPGLGDTEFASRGFSLPERMQVTVYCQGEFAHDEDGAVDGGWILNAETRELVWEFGPDNFKHGGGAQKNKVSRETITLPRGDYLAYYATDDSHSRDGWNDPPPYDPDGWGLLLWGQTAAEARRVRPFTDADEARRTLVALVRQGDGVLVSQGLTLRRAAKVRVYCVGEFSWSQGEFADSGLIERFGSGDAVWSMAEGNTRPAGGARKNRVADEVVELVAGDYVVSYSTDDTHAYGAWNAAPPRDPQRWGITLFAGAELDAKDYALFDATERAEAGKGYLVRLVRVRSSQHVRAHFSLDKPTQVRIIAIGEGLYNEMYDYGWIEALAGGTWVWEMTMRNTRHAGGDEKNRIFDGTLLLDKGEYVVHFVTDDSHAWSKWNKPRPRDPNGWGITILPVRR